MNENNHLKKCIPYHPKQIEIENQVFREIHRDYIFSQNRTALLLRLSNKCEYFFSDSAKGPLKSSHRREAVPVR